ncbi:MAG: hypothetical protein IKV94_03495 [Clostridia bacterium]|nr:hypothetical protein [Clostridia bacterium]
MEKEKNVTKEEDYKDLPSFKMRRLDCLKQQTKNGEEYYMFNGIVRFGDKAQLLTFFTKDEDLYTEVLAIPVNHDFNLYYELYLDYQNNWKVKPVAVSL